MCDTWWKSMNKGVNKLEIDQASRVESLVLWVFWNAIDLRKYKITSFKRTLGCYNLLIKSKL